MTSLDYKLINFDGFPKNNGNGESDICIVFDLMKDCCLSKYIFIEDDNGEDCSYWSNIPEHQQHRIIIWAYLPDLPNEIFNKYIQSKKGMKVK